MSQNSANEQQSVYLKECLAAVRIQSRLMKQCLDKNRLMDGIKHCSNMLAELRTSVLTPKNYYELYITIFDLMRHLIIYLSESHKARKHHLGDLYELVQYANSIVPRLYLMITVGSIYLSVDDAPPVAEVMSDMMEMTRGVQHPIRGLFLRHYLGGMTRDFLPNNDENLPASIQFILTNFAEMNKLWVRLQHMGHTRDTARRESERKELGTLVGTNLVRLSQLEGVDLNVYRTDILPGILSQVINCHDVMAQEYLMEVIIQIFPDEFHIHTLRPFLATTAQLHPKVNIKMIIIALLDRLAAYAQDEQGQFEESQDNVLFIMFWNEIMELVKTRQDLPIQDITSLFLSLANFSISCYPDRLDYMDQILQFTKESIFNTYAPELHTKQSESNVLQLLLLPAKTWDVLTLITTLKYYQPLLAMQPYTTRRTTGLTILDNILSKETRIDQPEQVYQILEICHVLIKDKTKTQQLYQQYEDDDDRDEQGWVARLVHLFYSDDEDAQFLLLSAARQQLEDGDAQRIKTVFPSLIVSGLRLARRYYNKHQHKQIEEIEVKQVEVEETSEMEETSRAEENSKMEETSEKEEISDMEETGKMEENNEMEDAALKSQTTTSDHGDLTTTDDNGEQRSNVGKTIQTSDSDPADHSEKNDNEWAKKMTTLFRFIHQIIKILHRQGENTDSTCVQFSLMAGQSADYCGFDEIAYNFFLDALRIYEESVSHSKAQFHAIVYAIGSLLTTSPRLKGPQYYTILSTKITLLSTKLLKKPDQSRAVYTSSHLWTEEAPARVLECLQKSLKIADSCMDNITNEMLNLELLNQYMYYFEKEQELITVNYLNGLIDLIQSRLIYLDQADQYPITSSSSSLITHDESEIVDYIKRQFNQTMQYLNEHQQDRYNDIEIP